MKGDKTMSNNTSVIIKFDFSAEQTVGQVTKAVGLVKAR